MRALPGWPATLTEKDVTVRPHHRSDAEAWRRVRLANQEWLEQWEASVPLSWQQRHRLRGFTEM
ncbi:MAG: hypothetical protein ACRDTD_32920, partial [Pseudonocardiaceae bacterium]